MNRFPTGEEKELELWCRKCKAFTDEKHGCKDCKKCGTDTKMKPDWENGAKKIKLTKGKYALVDKEDYEELNKLNWFLGGSKGKLYAMRSKTINGKKRSILMHRVIMGNPKGKMIDHKDGNTLNNQRANLRLCNDSQNAINRKMQSNNKSGYRGVFYIAKNKSKPWVSAIGFQGKQIIGGTFTDKESAARKYNELALKYHGEFACLNPLTNLLKQKGE